MRVEISHGLVKIVKSDLSATVNNLILVRFQVLMAASMMFRAVFWVVLPCKMIVDNNFTRQYNPEDSSEQSDTYITAQTGRFHMKSVSPIREALHAM
jgi:hypothetical protein